MDAITGLLAGLRGEQPPGQRWDPAAHNQSTHGRIDPGVITKNSIQQGGASNENIGDSTG